MESLDDGKELTSFESICAILSELWISYKQDKEFTEFVSYNDLGLPLAFLIDSELVSPSESAKKYIYETWEIFLVSLNLDEDAGWSSLQELFAYVEFKNKGKK
jgi:hypothetical protein